jgi:hypothetical protein
VRWSYCLGTGRTVRAARQLGDWEQLDEDRKWYQGAVDTFREWSDEATLVLGVATVLGCVACGFVAAGISTVSAVDKCANSSGRDCAVGVASAGLSVAGAGATVASRGLNSAGARLATASDDFGYSATNHVLQGNLIRGFGNGAAAHYTRSAALRLQHAGGPFALLADDLARLGTAYDAVAWAGT